MSSKFADNTATYSEVDVTKKKTRIAAKKDKPPEILSDIPMYSEINRVSETSAPRSADTAFDNQVYSMGTSDNTYSKLNRTVEQSRQANPATPHDNVLGTKTAPHKEKSKKDQSERNLVCIVISVIILLLLAVGAVAVAALVQVSKLNIEIVSIRASPPLTEDSKLNSEIASIRASLSNSSASLNDEIVFLRASLLNFSASLNDEMVTLQLSLSNSSASLNDEIVFLRASLSNSSVVLSRNISELKNKTQIRFDGLDSRVNNLYAILYMNWNINPAASCLLLNPSSPSGHYWIRSFNGSAVRVYCDMTRSCGNITGGWMRVASLNWSNESLPCPDGFRERSHLNIHTCGIGSIGSCSSLIFKTYSTVYSRVCGKIKAYQVGSPDAFGTHKRDTNVNIDSNYMDGVSLTHGSDPRRHIWTFVAAVNDDLSSIRSRSLCQCVKPGDTSIMASPSFVGMDYFCDTGNKGASTSNTKFYSADPLWDGAGCASTSMCCSFNNPPWFYKQLPSATTDDIEMRVCIDEGKDNEDIAISNIELYVQ